MSLPVSGMPQKRRDVRQQSIRSIFVHLFLSRILQRRQYQIILYLLQSLYLLVLKVFQFIVIMFLKALEVEGRRYMMACMTI